MARTFVVGGFLAVLCLVTARAEDTAGLSLTQAVRIAEQHNPECIAARSSADASQGRLWKGISPPPPQIAFTYDYIPTGSGIGFYGERAVVLTQNIDFPSTYVLRGTALRAETDAARADAALTALTVALNVKRVYCEVLARREKLRLAREHAEIARDVAAKAEIRARVGEASDLEQLSARIQEVQARDAIETARNDLSLSFGELHLLLGHRVEQQREELILTDTLGYRSHQLDPEEMIAEALRTHAGMDAARARRDAASTGTALAWSSFLPSFSVSYARQVQGTETGLYGVSLGVSIPVWFLLDQRGQIQEAAARSAGASADLSARENALAHAIRNAYLSFTNEERQVRLYAGSLLPQSEEVFRVAQASYDAGDVPYTEYLQARQTLIAARTGYVDALLRYNTAFAQLEFAVGHDLSDR